jgi:hypothetical protein
MDLVDLSKKISITIFILIGGRINLEELGFMKSLDFRCFKIKRISWYIRESRIVDGSIMLVINPPAFADIHPGTNNAYNNGHNGLTIGFP